MTAGEQTYRRARAAVERVLDEHGDQWEPIPIGVFLKAAPDLSWRAINGALQRLAEEGRLRACRKGYRDQHVVHVVDLRAVDRENARRAAVRASAAAAAAGEAPR